MTADLEHRVERAVRAVVPPTATVRRGAPEPPFVHLKVNGHALHTYWLRDGRPGQVRDALRRLGRQRPQVFVTRRMSPEAQTVAREAGVGWVDEAGGAEVTLDWLIISREGLENPEDERPRRWTPSFCGVTEALLLGAKPTVGEVAQATGLSLDTCRRALRFFTERGFLAASARRGPSSGRHLIDSAHLLEEYAGAVVALPRTELRVGVLWRDPVSSVAGLGARWEAANIRWAATGAVAASVLAPFLTEVGTAEVFVEAETLSDLLRAAESVGAKPMEGGRLLLCTFPSLATERLSTQKGDLRVAPWPRVYADLRRQGVRGEDAAEHLREVMHVA